MPNALLNLPFFLQALGRGSKGYVEGQEAADRHAALAHQMMMQDKQEGRAEQLFPEQLRSLQIGNTNANAPNEESPDQLNFYNENVDKDPVTKQPEATFKGNRRDAAAEAAFYNQKKSRQNALQRVLQKPTTTPAGSKDPNRDLRELSKSASADVSKWAGYLAKWHSADPIDMKIKQSIAQELGIQNPAQVEAVLNKNLADAQKRAKDARAAYAAKVPGAADESMTDPKQTPGGKGIVISPDTLNAFKDAIKAK